ncbi:MAG TPA: diiron oxygenase [Kofleriaceae bacterium]|nr:diiron oxygenase [Kofleriaceae bacterium]
MTTQGARRRDVGEILEVLCAASRRRYQNPYTAIAWPDALAGAAYVYFSPELSSLDGLPAYTALPEEQRRRAGLFEIGGYFSLTLHGEQRLMAGVLRLLYRSSVRAYSDYLHHLIDEENKHMVYFAEFSRRFVGKLYPDKHLPRAPREGYAPGEEELQIFASIWIFEQLGDYFSLGLMRDTRVDPIVRQVCRLHHHEESRHLVFGREVVKDLVARFGPGFSEATRDGLRRYLDQFIAASWAEYYNPDVYRDAGLPEPYALRKAALRSDASRARFAQAVGPVTELLRELDLALPASPPPASQPGA